jgi:hypothetical protein
MSKLCSLAAATLVSVLAAGALVTAQGRVIASATGSGHVTVNGAMRTFAFTVHRNATGTASGQMEVINRDLGVRVHATLNCLNVVGNTAIVSGQVTDTNNPVLEDTYFWFKVVDNGEGSKAPADKMTFALTVIPTLTCDTDLNVPYLDVEKGNIQIRP